MLSIDRRAEVPDATPVEAAEITYVDHGIGYATRTHRIAESAADIAFLLGIPPDVRSMAPGAPADKRLPIELMPELLRKGIDLFGPRVLQYGAPEGHPLLRKVAIEHFAELGVIVGKGVVVLVTNGSQGGLDAMGKIVINPGDGILVTAPTYLGALSAFNAYEPQYVVYDPMQPETLRAALTRKDIRIKFMYTNPTLSNPDGVTIPDKQRQEHMQILEEHEDRTGERIIVAEDVAYNMLNLDGEVLPRTYYALDNPDRRRVVVLGTTSKSLAPGLRIGFMAAPQDVAKRLIEAKPDLCTGNLPQALATVFLADGYLQAWLPGTIAHYRRQRDVMHDALKAYMPPGWKINMGPMFAWIEGPLGINTQLALEEAITHKIAFLTGKPFYPDRRNPMGLRTARLNFTNLPQQDLVECDEIIGGIFSRQQASLVASGRVYP